MVWWCWYWCGSVGIVVELRVVVLVVSLVVNGYCDDGGECGGGYCVGGHGAGECGCGGCGGSDGCSGSEKKLVD